MRRLFGESKEVLSKMFAVLKKSMYAMCEQISEGLRLWVWLLQLGLSLLPSHNNGPRLHDQ